MVLAAVEAVPSKPVQRWSAARKRDVVLRLLRGESIEAVSRQIGIEPFRLEQWRERALAALVTGKTCARAQRREKCGLRRCERGSGISEGAFRDRHARPQRR
jgi:hypothetical protein